MAGVPAIHRLLKRRLILLAVQQLASVRFCDCTHIYASSHGINSEHRALYAMCMIGAASQRASPNLAGGETPVGLSSWLACSNLSAKLSVQSTAGKITVNMLLSKLCLD